jgi:hypothetical protein
MRTASRLVFLAAMLASLGACSKEEEVVARLRRPRPTILQFLPPVDRSLVVDTSGTEDAEQITFVVSLSADSVARYYRALLPAANWRIVSDRASGPFIDIYAEGGMRPASLWVHIERQDTASTRYILIARGPQAAQTPPSTSPAR